MSWNSRRQPESQSLAKGKSFHEQETTHQTRSSAGLRRQRRSRHSVGRQGARLAFVRWEEANRVDPQASRELRRPRALRDVRSGSDRGTQVRPTGADRVQDVGRRRNRSRFARPDAEGLLAAERGGRSAHARCAHRLRAADRRRAGLGQRRLPLCGRRRHRLSNEAVRPRPPLGVARRPGDVSRLQGGAGKRHGLRHRQRPREAATTRRDGPGLDDHKNDSREQEQGLGPARHVRVGQSLRRIRQADAGAAGPRAGSGRVRRRHESQRQPRAGARRLFDLFLDRPAFDSQEVRRPPPPRLARPRHRSGTGVLGGDEPDGGLRGRQSRRHSPARLVAVRCGSRRRRGESPQLRLEGDARRPRGDRPPQGRDAGRRGRARSHSGIDGLAGLRRPGPGQPRFARVRLARGGPGVVAQERRRRSTASRPSRTTWPRRACTSSPPERTKCRASTRTSTT